MLKVVTISDTHCMHDKLHIPECDLLLHAGDYSSRGRIEEVKGFLEWFSKQPAKHKIFIDGNHDGMSEENPKLFEEILKEYPSVRYLRNEGIEVEGIKIWGRPITPSFYDWHHMADRGSPKMLTSLSIIPDDIDILLTHGPAAGILDANNQGESCGCYDLLNELERLKNLKVMVFGHIHHSSGEKEVNGIKHINASVLNDNYKLTFYPKSFDI